MKIFICGIEGYLGWSLAVHLAARGHTVGGLDMGFRDQWVREVGSQSAIPVFPITDRIAAVREHYGSSIKHYPCDMRSYDGLVSWLKDFYPEAIVHLAEQPSAPFSMRSPRHAFMTQENNVLGSLNLLWAVRAVNREIHILKLGTMGEYGTPDVLIPEAGPESFPRQPGSLYHASKVADSVNTEFACRVWNLRSTDVMQGVVYGTRIDASSHNDERLRTRFDFDESFGTAINRFCAQATVNLPITPYGKGGQKRGFLPLRDSMQCMTLLLENPPEQGEYRVVNQLEEIYEINDLASRVAATAGIDVGGGVRNIGNPRIEKEDHFYEVEHQKLLDLGYQPTTDMDGELEGMLEDLAPHADRIKSCQDVIAPRTRWDK